MHWPRVSEKKKEELAMLKESIKTSPMKIKSSVLKSRAGNSEARAGSPDDFRSMKEGRAANSDNEADRGSKVRRKIIWKDNTIKPPEKPKREGIIVDYLQEQRKKRDQEGRSGIEQTKPDWKKEYDKMGLQGKEKYDVYLSKAKDFDNKAERKKKIIDVNNAASIEDIIELNDMYVESIKAKLEILNDFQ